MYEDVTVTLRKGLLEPLARSTTAFHMKLVDTLVGNDMTNLSVCRVQGS